MPTTRPSPHSSRPLTRTLRFLHALTCILCTLSSPDILELGFEFDLPYDINSTSLLNDVLDLKNLRALTLKTNYMVAMPSQLGTLFVGVYVCVYVV